MYRRPKLAILSSEEKFDLTVFFVFFFFKNARHMILLPCFLFRQNPQIARLCPHAALSAKSHPPPFPPPAPVYPLPIAPPSPPLSLVVCATSAMLASSRLHSVTDSSLPSRQRHASWECQIDDARSRVSAAFFRGGGIIFPFFLILIVGVQYSSYSWCFVLGILVLVLVLYVFCSSYVRICSLYVHTHSYIRTCFILNFVPCSLLLLLVACSLRAGYYRLQAVLRMYHTIT